MHAHHAHAMSYNLGLGIINARRMREGYCNHPVCLCVCVCVCLSVCYRPSADIWRVCDKIGLPV